ncbi:Uncharacterised protein [Xylophilus ampelinus]|nr:Uncharacterised protein [Xylophilus ampelinus]
MIRKSLIATTVALAGVFATSLATAHGVADPQHGGVVQGSADLSFELVAQPGGALIYVMDHDDEADVAKYSGKLTVLNGSAKSEGEIKPAGGNKLEVKGVALAKGAKAVAVIEGAGRKAITVRFTMR